MPEDPVKKTHIHLVRHGQVYNPKQILYGRLPRFNLSGQGRRQARAAGRILSDKPIAALFSSPLLRARQTGQELIKYLPATKMRISTWLNEVYSPYEGHPGATIDTRKGDIYTGTDPCFEQPQDVHARIQQFFKRTRRYHAGRQVVAVTHGDVITFTVLWAKGFDLTPKNKTRLLHAGYPDAYPAHASITTIIYESDSHKERPQIEYIRS